MNISAGSADDEKTNEAYVGPANEKIQPPPYKTTIYREGEEDEEILVDKDTLDVLNNTARDQILGGAGGEPRMADGGSSGMDAVAGTGDVDSVYGEFDHLKTEIPAKKINGVPMSKLVRYLLPLAIFLPFSIFFSLSLSSYIFLPISLSLSFSWLCTSNHCYV